MTQTTQTRIYDWADIVAMAEDGQRPPATTYQFSNGRKFTRMPQPSPEPTVATEIFQPADLLEQDRFQ